MRSRDPATRARSAAGFLALYGASVALFASAMTMIAGH